MRIHNIGLIAAAVLALAVPAQANGVPESIVVHNPLANEVSVSFRPDGSPAEHAHHGTIGAGQSWRVVLESENERKIVPGLLPPEINSARPLPAKAVDGDLTIEALASEGPGLTGHSHLVLMCKAVRRLRIPAHTEVDVTVHHDGNRCWIN